MRGSKAKKLRKLAKTREEYRKLKRLAQDGYDPQYRMSTFSIFEDLKDEEE